MYNPAPFVDAMAIIGTGLYMFGLNEISTIGSGLHRPECVLATGNGRLYAADWRGGVSIIEPGGQQWSLLAKDAGFDVKPNGIALMPDGSFLLAHLGDQEGGVYRLAPDGALTPFCVEVDGQDAAANQLSASG